MQGFFLNHCPRDNFCPQANDHALLCPNYRPPDALDWLRRLGGPGQAVQEEEEDENQEPRLYRVTAEARGKGNTLTNGSHKLPLILTPYDKTISPRTDRSPPSQPFHLREPTHLSVSQECLHPLQVSVTYVTLVTVYSECLHPLQPAPTKIRSFVCAKVFRRDEIASHLTAVHQTIVPGMNSSWLQIRSVTHFQRRLEKTLAGVPLRGLAAHGLPQDRPHFQKRSLAID